MSTAPAKRRASGLLTRVVTALVVATATAALGAGPATAAKHHGHRHAPSVKTRHRHHKRAHFGAIHNPYAGGGCTAWAWVNRTDLPGNLGNALSWGNNAKRHGFPVDNTPEVGAIAVYQPGSYGAFRPYGHVAVVEAIQGNRIYISEASYNPRLRDHGDHEIYHRWTGIVGVQFIHQKGYHPPIGSPTQPQPPKPAPPGQPPFWAYRVYGTCADGGCGLRERTGPGYSGYASVGLKHDGDEVDIVCQTRGERVTGASGRSSTVWDKLTDGHYVTDYYVNTPNVDQFTAPIPHC